MKHDITFIGELPPPFNGVSVKDRNLLEHLFDSCDVQVIDLVECKRNPMKIPVIFGRIAMAMIRSKTIVIGVGALQREKVLLTMQRILTGHKGLKKVMMIVMGGRYHELIRKDKYHRNLLYHVGSIWAESKKMIEGLKEQGITQVYLFPNCRTEEGALAPVERPPQEPLRLVYFARIDVKKGAGYIFDAFNNFNLSDLVELDFYGELSDNIKVPFLEFIKNHSNVKYLGVYDATDTYTVLNQYDVMILPTEWKGEGVAGTLVEAKMAGITAIVSDCGFNSETVRNGEEGIVIHQPMAENLAKSIDLLISDRVLLKKLKNGAYESRKRYCISTYKQQMIECVLKGRFLNEMKE